MESAVGTLYLERMANRLGRPLLRSSSIGTQCDPQMHALLLEISICSAMQAKSTTCAPTVAVVPMVAISVISAVPHVFRKGTPDILPGYSLQIICAVGRWPSLQNIGESKLWLISYWTIQAGTDSSWYSEPWDGSSGGSYRNCPP